MRSCFFRAAVLGLVIATAAAVVAEPALAASAKDIGRHLGDTLKLWAGSIFAGVAAIMACVYLAQRNVVQGLVFFGLAVVLGLFVVSQSTSANLIASFWKLIVNGR